MLSILTRSNPGDLLKDIYEKAAGFCWISLVFSKSSAITRWLAQLTAVIEQKSVKSQRVFKSFRSFFIG